ncbi:MAG: hypothetical protein H6679_01805 [Epsilonproteobacteria bacterium]|nr:hypothetical protein [Campylobacterota bacterium]
MVTRSHKALVLAIALIGSIGSSFAGDKLTLPKKAIHSKTVDATSKKLKNWGTGIIGLGLGLASMYTANKYLPGTLLHYTGSILPGLIVGGLSGAGSYYRCNQLWNYIAELKNSQLWFKTGLTEEMVDQVNPTKEVDSDDINTTVKALDKLTKGNASLEEAEKHSEHIDATLKALYNVKRKMGYYNISDLTAETIDKLITNAQAIKDMQKITINTSS